MATATIQRFLLAFKRASGMLNALGGNQVSLTVRLWAIPGTFSTTDSHKLAHGASARCPILCNTVFSRNKTMLPANAVRISGTLINPNDPTDARSVRWEAVYGGWRDDSKGSRTYGKIYTDATMDAIVATYPDLEVVTV